MKMGKTTSASARKASVEGRNTLLPIVGQPEVRWGSIDAQAASLFLVRGPGAA